MTTIPILLTRFSFSPGITFRYFKRCAEFFSPGTLYNSPTSEILRFLSINFSSREQEFFIIGGMMIFMSIRRISGRAVNRPQNLRFLQRFLLLAYKTKKRDTTKRIIDRMRKGTNPIPIDGRPIEISRIKRIAKRNTGITPTTLISRRRIKLPIALKKSFIFPPFFNRLKLLYSLSSVFQDHPTPIYTTAGEREQKIIPDSNLH